MYMFVWNMQQFEYQSLITETLLCISSLVSILTPASDSGTKAPEHGVCEWIVHVSCDFFLRIKLLLHLKIMYFTSNAAVHVCMYVWMHIRAYVCVHTFSLLRLWFNSELGPVYFRLFAITECHQKTIVFPYSFLQDVLFCILRLAWH